GGFGRFPWLTLRVCLPINAPDRASLRRRGLSAISMVLSAATSCGRIADAVGTGECPEWQRELTVNQPPHGFEGSSPASPTSLRPMGYAWRSRALSAAAMRVRRSLSHAKAKADCLRSYDLPIRQPCSFAHRFAAE